ncbi:hypothetical protein EMIT043CA1_20307 [Pseudomonas brassicacearum]
MRRWRLERRHREQARSHMGCGVFTELQLTKIPVGAELARDGIALVYRMHRGFASRASLAPTSSAPTWVVGCSQSCN